MPVLEVKHLAYAYKGNPLSRFAGIHSISFSIEPGTSMILMGESGCGKSTLLQCLAGKMDLDAGEIYVDKKRLLGPAYHLVPDHADIQLVNQQVDLLEQHTCKENIAIRLGRYKDAYKHQKTNWLLRYFNLLHVQQQKAWQLSTGQRQRLSIARALANLPKILLLDEPFSNLDHALKIKALAYLNEQKMKTGLSYLLVTHQAEDALRNADLIYIMKNGKWVQKSIAKDTYFKPKNLYAAELLGAYNLLKKDQVQYHLPFHFLGKNIFFRPSEKEKLRHLLSHNTCTLLSEHDHGYLQEKIWRCGDETFTEIV